MKYTGIIYYKLYIISDILVHGIYINMLTIIKLCHGFWYHGISHKTTIDHTHMYKNEIILNTL